MHTYLSLGVMRCSEIFQGYPEIYKSLFRGASEIRGDREDHLTNWTRLELRLKKILRILQTCKNYEIFAFVFFFPIISFLSLVSNHFFPPHSTTTRIYFRSYFSGRSCKHAKKYPGNTWICFSFTGRNLIFLFVNRIKKVQS